MRIQSDPPINTQDDYSAGAAVAASTGLWRGRPAKSVYVLGRRTVFNSASAFQDIAQYLVGGQNLFNPVVSGTEYFIVSTDALDVAGSAGVSQVRIVYLDRSGTERTKTVVLNGDTKVSIGSDFSAIQWMESAVMGTAAAVVSAGTISIYSGAGAAAAEATSVEQILLGGNRSLSCRYTVPLNHTAYITGWTTASPGSQKQDIRLRADVFADDRKLSKGIFHFQATSYLAAESTPYREELGWLKLPSGSTVKASTLPAATTGTPRCDVNIQMLLVQD